MNFHSTILILPGFGSSGPEHWQTLWEEQFGFTRVQQENWVTPRRDDWVRTLDAAVLQHNLSEVILVAHSLACATVGFWAATYQRKIKGALLVAPADTEADSCPPGADGFTPMPDTRLPFPSITVISTDDPYAQTERAELFARNWDSRAMHIGPAGHINAGSKIGMWEEGLALLKELDG